MKTSDLYEAAYYIMHGAKVTDCSFTVSSRSGKEYSVLTLAPVDSALQRKWKLSQASGNLKQFVGIRKHLKKTYGRRHDKEPSMSMQQRQEVQTLPPV